MTRLFPIFSVAFAVLYVVCMHYNIAAVIYYPRLGEWHRHALDHDGPPMFMYGWMIYAFLGAVVVASVAALVPAALTAKIWSGWTWLICLGALGVSVYLMYGIWMAPRQTAPAAAMEQPPPTSGH